MERLKEILDSPEPLKNLSRHSIEKNELVVFPNLFREKTHICYIIWEKKTKDLLNQNPQLKKAIQKQLVKNLVNLKENILVLNLSRYYLDDEDYVICLSEETEVNPHISGIFWGKTNEQKYNGHGLKRQIDRSITKNINERYRQYPSDYVHCLLLSHCRNDRNFAERNFFSAKIAELGWQIHDKPFKDKTYVSVLYINNRTKQLVLAFRGLRMNLHDLYSDKDFLRESVYGAFGNEITSHSYYAYLHAKQANELSKSTGYSLSFTGYSFGAWLAEQCIYFAYQAFKNLDVKAITFDSPGSFDIIEELMDANIINKNRNIDELCKILNIKTYLMAPNFINTCNRHVGRVYRIIDNRKEDKQKSEMDEFMNKLIETIPSRTVKTKFAQWYKKAKDHFRQYKFFLEGIRSLFTDDLGWLLNEFDERTGEVKSKERFYEVLKWPKLDLKIKRDNIDQIQFNTAEFFLNLIPGMQFVPPAVIKLVAGGIDTVVNAGIRKFTKKLLPNIVLILTVVVEIKCGRMNAQQCLDFYRYDPVELPPEISPAFEEKELLRNDRFDLQFKCRYHLVRANLMYDDLVIYDPSHIDKKLVEFYTNTNNKYKSSEIYERFKNLRSFFTIKTEIQGNVETGWIKSEEIEIESIRERFRRMLKVERCLKDLSGIDNSIIESAHVMRDNFGGYEIIEHFEERNANVFNHIDRILQKNTFAYIFGDTGAGKTTLAVQYAYYRKKVHSCGVQYLISYTLPHNIVELKARVFGENFSFRMDNKNHEEWLKKIIDKVKDKNILLILDGVKQLHDIQKIMMHADPKNHRILITTRDASLFNTLDPRKELGIEANLTEQFEKIKVSMVRKENKLAFEILKYLAFLDGDFIDLELINKIFPAEIDVPGHGVMPLADFNNAIKLLTEKKILVENREMADTYTMHEISQNEMKTIVNENRAEKSTIMFRLTHCLNDLLAIEKEDLVNEDYRKLVKINKHTDKLIDEKWERKIEDEKFLRLLNKIEIVNIEVFQDSEESIRILEKIVQIRKVIQAPNCYIQIANLYAQIGNVCRIQEREAEAMNHYYNAIRYLKKNLDAQDNPGESFITSVTTSVRNDMKKGENSAIDFIELFSKFDKININTLLSYEEMKSILKNMIEIIEKQNAADQKAKLLQFMMYLASIYQKEGKYDDALIYYKKCRDIVRRSERPNKIQLANIIVYMGIVYYKRGSKNEAFEYFTDALKELKSVSEDHAALICPLENLGMLSESRRKFEEAMGYYKEALEIRKKKLRPNHLDIGKSWDNIGSIYYELKKYDEALEYFERSMDIKEQNRLPANHQDWAFTYHFLGSIYRKKQEYDKSLEFYTKALDIRKQTSNSLEVANVFNDIGLVHFWKPDYEKALEMYLDSYEIKKSILPEDSLPIADLLYNIGASYYKLKQYDEAIEYYKKALEIRKNKLDADNSDISDTEKSIENAERKKRELK